jgi:hypothetical protein
MTEPASLLADVACSVRAGAPSPSAAESATTLLLDHNRPPRYAPQLLTNPTRSLTPPQPVKTLPCPPRRSDPERALDSRLAFRGEALAKHRLRLPTMSPALPPPSAIPAGRTHPDRLPSVGRQR